MAGAGVFRESAGRAKVARWLKRVAPGVVDGIARDAIEKGR